jgi:hypothetical protein
MKEEIAIIRQWGFKVEIQEGGVMLRAENDTLSRLRKDPEACHLLATLAHHAARLAAAVGGEAVVALPALIEN